MFRLAKLLPLVVVSPRPWFPGQSLIRLFVPHYRPLPAKQEIQNGITVHFPRFIALPGFFRSLDSLFMFLASYRLLRRLKSAGYNHIDAHFAYPDGHAAVILGRWLDLSVTVTLRGTEVPHSRKRSTRRKLQTVVHQANKIIAVSDSLQRLAVELGMSSERGMVVGNGVDTDRFRPVDRIAARARYKIPEEAKVLITVGALVERKGFHRVINCLPALLDRHPNLHYLIVGGASPEGNMEAMLRAQVQTLNLNERVHFLGSLSPDELKWPLSAADVFVLASRNEGWANVILEAMACKLPVVTTDVGGNREVVASDTLGYIVPFGDHYALLDALDRALRRDWDRDTILAYAQKNDWDGRVNTLARLMIEIASEVKKN